MVRAMSDRPTFFARLARAGLTLGAAALALTMMPISATAQLRRVPGTPPPQPISRNEPVTFTADRLEYDRDKQVVTATGNVEAWQNDNVLKADRVTFDRTTNVAAATGNVVLVQPDGQVVFSDYAELTEGLRDGVLKGMRALLAENGRLVANSARRFTGARGGELNELSRAVYTTCNLCANDPTRSPLWQIRSRSAVQDKENERVEYKDAVLDIYGVPVVWLPYFWHVDPSVRRGSGFLIPSFGTATRLGAFLTTPYYWAIDPQSDLTATPTFNTLNVLNLNTEYRRRFNDGTLTVDAGLGYDEKKPQADIFARGRFAYDDTWRYGFDLNRASSARYLRDYRAQNRADVLTSRLFIEGFGTGTYTRLDTIAFQGLVASVNQSRLPYVLPRYSYSFVGEPDSLGGRINFETQNFNILRQQGTNTQRLAATLNWERPFIGPIGEVYGLTLQGLAAGYTATGLNQNPNYAPIASTETARGHAQAALKVSWPLLRPTSRGSQLIEPIFQIIAAPNTGAGRRYKIPNEDSLDFEFTDANLFALNRYPGVDRLEGGVRANVGLHLNWTVGTGFVDALVGESFRSHRDGTFPVGSGLEQRASDLVTRATISPGPYLDVTARTRLDHNTRQVRFADTVASVGGAPLRLGVGYIYSTVNPYALYDTPTVPASYFVHRNEVSLNASTQLFDHYKASGFVRRDLNSSRLTATGLRGTYEDECLIVDLNYSRRYTSLNGDNGASLFLIQLTFKTVGQVGYNAL